MAKLYELSQDYEMLYEQLENIDPESEGAVELVQAFRDTLEGIKGEFDMTAEALAVMVKRINADAKAIKEEKDKLIKRQKSAEAKAEWIKNYLFDNMRRLNESKIETPKAVLSIRNNPESVNIADPAAFIEWAQANNNSLLVYKEPEISKSALKNELKAGIEIPGVELQRTQTLQIR